MKDYKLQENGLNIPNNVAKDKTVLEIDHLKIIQHETYMKNQPETCIECLYTVENFQISYQISAFY